MSTFGRVRIITLRHVLAAGVNLGILEVPLPYDNKAVSNPGEPFVCTLVGDRGLAVVGQNQPQSVQ